MHCAVEMYAWEWACTSTFLLTHRFHALSDKIIWCSGIRCLQFLKEFHALDVVVVPKLCHHVLSTPPLVLVGSPHGKVHSMQCNPSPSRHLVTKCQISLLRGRNCSCFHVFRAFYHSSLRPAQAARRDWGGVGKSLLACGDRQQLARASLPGHLASPPSQTQRPQTFLGKKYSHLWL